MTDTLSADERSHRMSLVKSKGSNAEVELRRLVHSLGYRYRLHVAALPGKPDLVFPARKQVIFMHGCFWHRHSDGRCRLARLPKSRLEYWLPKLEANRQRDISTRARLSRLGWSSMVVWECQINDKHALMSNVRKFLDRRAD